MKKFNTITIIFVLLILFFIPYVKASSVTMNLPNNEVENETENQNTLEGNATNTVSNTLSNSSTNTAPV